MSWLIVLLVLLAAFGPVAYFMPSRRDRQLADLREQARRLGVDVSLARLPKLAASPDERVSPGGQRRVPVLDCVDWSLRTERGDADWPRVRLLRHERTEFPALPELADWELDRSFHPAAPPQAVLARLASYVSDVPADAVGLALSEGRASLYWHERGFDGDSAARAQAVHEVLQRLVQVTGPDD